MNGANNRIGPTQGMINLEASGKPFRYVIIERPILERTFKDELWSKDGSISQQSWETASAVAREAGILKQDVKYDEIIDNRFLASVKAEAAR